MPNLVALTSEYAPQKMRSTLVTTMFSGYAVAALWLLYWVHGLPKLWLADHVFYCRYSFIFIAGNLKFLLRVSLAFIVKENKQDKARGTLSGKAGAKSAVSESTVFSLPKVDVPESANVVSLFRRGRAAKRFCSGWRSLPAC